MTEKYSASCNSVLS